jgi:diguanylate cyclase
MQHRGAPIRPAFPRWLARGKWRHTGLLALVPLLTLLALWPGLPLWVRVCALLGQGVVLVLLSRGRFRPRASAMRSRAAVNALLASAPEGHGAGAALVIRLDDAARLTDRLGRRGSARLMALLSRRLDRALRGTDAFCALPDLAGFGIALHPQRRLDDAAARAIALRLRDALSAPCMVQGAAVQPSFSVGFSLCDRVRKPDEPSAFDAALIAATRAAHSGPGTVEADTLRHPLPCHHAKDSEELVNALESGAITAHFQPQICLRTGKVSGCEALARWLHPHRGLVPPAAFLPALEAAGLNTTLAITMLRNSLALLSMLEGRGLHLPTVSINLTERDLRREDLPDRIAWELDRHDIPPERLTLEIVESVTTDSDDDLPVRTIARLAEMGCVIDLDDYGTGNASIIGIRRFAVNRLKVDRSYVRHLDSDARQRQLVAAIVSMARALDLQTLAEGVETPQELDALVALGCDHAQGFGIARPMPAAALADWLSRFSQTAPQRQTG